MTERTISCRLQNLQMMASPSRWPLHPWLPLQRGPDSNPAAELGVLYDAWGQSGTPGYSATVYFVNVVVAPLAADELFALPHETYDTLDELYDAGWRVD
jgi:hypothetical protein